MAKAEAPVDMVTVVYDAGGRALTKSFELQRGKVVKRAYPNVAEVHAVERQAAGFDGLAATLDEVMQEGRGAIIRGKPGPLYPRHGGPAFRLLMPQVGLTYAATGRRVPQQRIRQHKLVADGIQLLDVIWLPSFVDQTRQWALADIDRVPVPPELADIWVDEPETAVEHVLAQFPETWRDASCWWALSSSAALPDPGGRQLAQTLKLHLGFWLSRPLAGAELKRWMASEGAPVDPAVFGAIQLLYIAAPGFGRGLHDPIPRRSGIRRGLTDVVAVPDQLLQPGPLSASDTATFGATEDLDELAAALRTRLANELHVREHLAAAARAHVRDHGSEIDAAPLVAMLEAVACEHRSREEVAGYGVERLVAHIIDRSRIHLVAPTTPHFQAEELAPDIASHRLDRAVREWFQLALGHMPEPGRPAPVRGIKAPAGLGKTAAVLKAIAANPGAIADYYVPSHRLADELAGEARALGIDATVIRGREHQGRDGEPLCRKADVAGPLGRVGLSVWEAVCERKHDDGRIERCCWFEGCRYVAQFRAPGRLRLMAHEYMTLRRRLGTPTLQVVDESFHAKVARHSGFALDRLTAPRAWRGLFGKVDPAKLNDLDTIAWEVRRALEAGQHPRDAGITVEDCKLAATTEIATAGGAPVSPGMAHDEQRRRVVAMQRVEAFKLWRCWQVLGGEIERPGPLQRIRLVRDVPRKGELEDRVELFWRAELRLRHVPTLVIDADLDTTIARSFWPEIEVAAIAARRNAQIIQVTDTACSRRRLLAWPDAPDAERRRAANRLADVQALLDVEGRRAPTLLVTYKAAAEKLQPPVGSEVIHFGALRGLDRFKGFGTVIIAGREQPAATGMEVQARSLFGDAIEPLTLTGSYTTAERNYRMRVRS